MGEKVMAGDKWWYHPTHGSELGWQKDERARKQAGWCDTPDDYPAELPKDFSRMDKDELLKYASDNYNVTLDKRKRESNLVKAIEALGG